MATGIINDTLHPRRGRDDDVVGESVIIGETFVGHPVDKAWSVGKFPARQQRNLDRSCYGAAKARLLLWDKPV
jgi:hypothetical protein